MRKGSSFGLLLAAGAGWLASNLWRNNTGGIRERLTEGSKRLREQGEQLWNQGAERARWSGTRFSQGMDSHRERPQKDYESEDWSYPRPGQSTERRPTDEH